MILAPRKSLPFLLSLLTVALSAQDGSTPNPYAVNYKRFTRGDNAPVMDEAQGKLDWFRERMGGDLGPDFVQRLLLEAGKERAKYPASFPRGGQGPLLPLAANGNAWTSIGPTSAAFTQNYYTLNKVDSGRPRVILPDPADATGNTVYILASGGGLWKTTNFLSNPPTWTAMTDFVGTTMAGSAAFGRSTSTLYVGAGDPFAAGVGGFMITTTDGGQTWSAAAPLGTAAPAVLDVKVDTTQPQDIVLVGTTKGLFRSTDGGATYGAVGTMTGQVWSLVQTSAGWLANSVDATATPAPGSLKLSTDHGATWTTVQSTVYTAAGRTTLGVGAPGDAVVYAYASTAGSYEQLDCFRSADGGLTWKALGISNLPPTNSNPDAPNMALMGYQAFYNQMLLVDPTDPNRNTLYLGGQLASAKSIDGGKTWTIVSDWLAQYGMPYIHADYHCAAFSNAGGVSRLFFGTDGGVFTSVDGGTTWDDTKNKGLVNHLIYALASNPGLPGSALIGLQDNGTRVRAGQTTVFNQIRGGDGFGVGWAQADTSATAASLSSYVYNSINLATTSPVADQNNWSLFQTGLGSTGINDSGQSYYFVTPIVTPPGTADPSGTVFYTYGNGNAGPNARKVFRGDVPTGWTVVGQAGVGGFSAGAYVRAVSHGIGVSPSDLDHLAAACNAGHVELTADGGVSWQDVFLGAEPTSVGMVPGWTGYNSNLAWANNNRLYLCSESPLAGSAHLAKSLDGGVTWTRSDTGLPDVPVTKLAVDAGDATGNTVYAATWLGVYRTTDGAATWSLLGTGLPQVRVSDIWVAPDSSVIRVATWGRGVWEMDSSFTAGSVSMNPTAGAIYANQTLNLTATVSGGGNVNWNASGGSITAATVSGVAAMFTPPAAPGIYGVTATNAANSGFSATANVVVKEPKIFGVGIEPATAISILAGTQIQFSAAASGGPDTTVTWSVAPSGSVVNGLFTAGLSAGTYTVTATSHQDPTKLASVMVSVVTDGEALLNPGFELNSGAPHYWTVTPDVFHSGGNAHSGSNWLWLDGYGTTHTDSAYQNVQIPNGLTGLVLSYWIKITSDETGGLANDTFKVQLRNADGSAVLSTLDTLSNLNNSGPASLGGTSSGTWMFKTYDLTPNLVQYQGQNVQVYVEGAENGSLTTNFEVDDFSLHGTFTPVTGPRVTINSPSSGTSVARGLPVSFIGTASAGTNPLNLTTYIWTWGDGSPATTGLLTPSHTFRAGGSSPVVTFSAADTKGTVSTATVTLTVQAASLDVNGDGVVDPLDLLTFSRNYGSTTNIPCDLNGDGTVSDLDLTVLLGGM